MSRQRPVIRLREDNILHRAGRVIEAPPPTRTNSEANTELHRSLDRANARFEAQCPCGRYHQSTPEKVRNGTVQCPKCEGEGS